MIIIDQLREIKDSWDRRYSVWDWVEMNVLPVVFAVFFVTAMISMFWSLGVILEESAKEEAEWRAWSSEHCTIVAKVSGQSFITTSINPSTGGVSVGSGGTSDQTIYRCDDGIQYTR